MAKHRLRRGNRLQFSTGGLLIAAGVGVGAFLLPVAPAAAEPITIPGIGTFEVPGVPPVPPVPSAPAPNPGPLPGPLPAPPAMPSTHGSQALAAAESKIGSPYVWGATGPNSFDCSGLVQWAYKQAGISVPRTTYDQLNGGSPVGKGNLQPGDLVLFNGAEHVGLYAGNGTVVHAPTAGQPVKQSPLDSMPFYAARRY
ncbi:MULTISPECIES: C40 family peptidase [unclassified Rhodococcus (in: high G+C Gram-positive bacteria)]|jgi:cell wall-associated NlpC family hydrolase|uniref:C40 family peptidase n=1 Tax=unclassified Rhodococcus (in: high G+C Gram-positive bacteria) TaxID=192944 RepID=UPI000B3D4677|nr:MULTISPECIES: C40 family peptidase [unclassified Rhodococcus (in: high G+C Gram-positive bacteria)]KAF0959679.1 putative endopeptidase [Rhodococcus sp. T7]OUS94645.1 hydrolase [Rhodococcus sp. NCIMB 12038]